MIVTGILEAPNDFNSSVTDEGGAVCNPWVGSWRETGRDIIIIYLPLCVQQIFKKHTAGC